MCEAGKRDFLAHARTLRPDGRLHKEKKLNLIKLTAF